MRWYWLLALGIVVLLLAYYGSTHYYTVKDKPKSDGTGKSPGSASPSSGDTSSCGTPPKAPSNVSFECIDGNWVGTPTGTISNDNEPFLKTSHGFMEFMCAPGSPGCNH